MLTYNKLGFHFKCANCLNSFNFNATDIPRVIRTHNKLALHVLLIITALGSFIRFSIVIHWTINNDKPYIYGAIKLMVKGICLNNENLFKFYV